MESIKAVSIDRNNDQNLDKDDLSEYEYLGIVHGKRDRNGCMQFHYILGNDKELILYKFADIVKGISCSIIPIISTHKRETIYTYVNFDKKKLYEVLQSRSNVLYVRQYF